MVRIFEVKELAERKQVLIAQSDVYRQTLKLQIATAQIAVNHLKTRLATIDISSFALKTAADIAGIFIAQSTSRIGGGFFSKVMSGIKLFGQIKDFFGRMKHPVAAPAPETNADS